MTLFALALAAAAAYSFLVSLCVSYYILERLRSIR